MDTKNTEPNEATDITEHNDVFKRRNRILSLKNREIYLNDT